MSGPRRGSCSRIRFIGVAVLLLSASVLSAQPLSESEIRDEWCAAQGGRAEVVLSDGTRADCVTATHAVEVEWAENWYEAVGQALHYARLTGKRAGIVLLLRGPGDERFWRRLSALVQHHGGIAELWRVRAGAGGWR